MQCEINNNNSYPKTDQKLTQLNFWSLFISAILIQQLITKKIQ